MKSEFFGFKAKLFLALALLVTSGAVVTGCYETEDGDLSLPAKKLPAVYTITGQVTDFATKAGINGATLTFSPAVKGSTTTNSSGNYAVTTETSGTLTVTVAAAGYTSQTATVVITPLEAGKAATYFLNVALLPDGYNPETALEVLSLTTTLGKSTKVFEADEVDQVDHVNYHSGDQDVSLKITVDSGAMIENAAWDDGLSNEFKSAIGVKFNELYSDAPGNAFVPLAYFYKIVLPATTSLKSVTVETYYKTDAFKFKFGAETVEVTVVSVPKVFYDHTLRSNAFGHGHGHGHGHGDNLNAGGGIVEPIF